MRLCFVLGTAAELIKIVPVIEEARARGWEWRALSTGQSPRALARQWEDFKLPVENFDVAMVTTDDLATSREALSWFWRAWWQKPRIKADHVIVHGDTLSTLIGAHWAKGLGIPVGHVEAGLRSKRLFSPFPEEISRRLVSRWSKLHFAPDAWAEENLELAGYTRGVVNTGANTLVDAVRLMLDQSSGQSAENYAVVNVHRFENLNSPARWDFISRTLLQAADKAELRVVMHAPTATKIAQNPDWRKRMEAKGARFFKRQPFSQFIREIYGAAFVISDGGSNQEECYYLGKPCLLLRAETERREGLGESCVLSLFDPQIVGDFLANPMRFARPPVFPRVSPSQLICDALVGAV